MLNHWLQDVLVTKLAENQSFQKMAVRTVEAQKQAQKLVEEGVKDPNAVKEGASTFLSHFIEHVKKDLGMTENAAQRAMPKGTGDKRDMR